MGARKVASQIKEDWRVDISFRTLSRYVTEGNIIVSPLKNGNPGKIVPWIFQTLCTALSSYIKSNQLNARVVDNGRKKLNSQLIEVMGKDKDVSMKLLNRILKETAVELLSKVTESVEDRRVKWTDYSNINIWFLNWEHDLEELGFSYRDDAVYIIIPDEQLH